MCSTKTRLLLCLLSISSVSVVHSARILGVFPLPSKSHQAVFKSYLEELNKKGHELVIITTEPFDDKKLSNVTEIDISEVYGKLFGKLKDMVRYKRGAIMDIDTVIDSEIYETILDIVVDAFNLPGVVQLISDKQQKFDLIVVEAFFEYQLIFSEIFKAPVIMFSSFVGFPEHYDMLGAASIHPVYYPSFHRMYYDNLGFWGSLKEIWNEIRMYKSLLVRQAHQDMLLKKNFGPNAPTTRQLGERVDMLFLSVHPMFANNRPVPPNVLYFHAPHLKPVKDLPKDLRTFLDKSRTGVIYVSFGTTINPSMIDKEFLDQFLKAFEALPYDIMWKFDGDDLSGIPKNVIVRKWFPQRDILSHPNVKVFITQGGIQSTSEAIDAGVPLVGVPMSAEQFYNTQKYVDFNIGVKLDTISLTANDLVEGVKNVIGNKSYKENVDRLRSIFQDQSEGPLDRAVWWTEYVLRHGGAKHLRTPSADDTFAEYYMLKYVLVIAGTLISVICLLIWSLYMLIKLVWRLVSRKPEKSQPKKVKRK